MPPTGQVNTYPILLCTTLISKIVLPISVASRIHLMISSNALTNEVCLHHDATQNLQGRYIGFEGDCTAANYPTAIVLPQQKIWSWETKVVATDAAAMAT